METILNGFEDVYNIMLNDYEKFYLVMQKNIKQTIDGMRSIDLRGAFEADDEVGNTFKEMVRMVGMLDDLLDKEPLELEANEKTT